MLTLSWSELKTWNLFGFSQETLENFKRFLIDDVKIHQDTEFEGWQIQAA